MTHITQTEADSRHVKRSDYKSCSVAFIDCKKPGSHLKENFSIIGPGVTSAKEQIVNIPERHGFSLGAAAMPAGITNNLHIHFTAEVFAIYKGEWTFRWGPNGENEFVGREGDVLSIPTWIFRGFTNNSVDDAWIFTALGGDDTGGVIFHPEIIDEAAQHGLYLSRENILIDTSKGDPVPSDDERILPMTKAEVESLREVSPEEMRQRIVTVEDRDYRPAFIDQNLPGCGVEIAPVLGHGLSQVRDHASRILNPHGFSMDWIRFQPGQKLSAFTLPDKMVLITRGAGLRLTLNETGDVVSDLGDWNTYSIPADVQREIENTSDQVVEALVMVAGDHQKRAQFRGEVIESARAGGLTIDPQGYVAEAHLVPRYGLAAE